MRRTAAEERDCGRMEGRDGPKRDASMIEKCTSEKKNNTRKRARERLLVKQTVHARVARATQLDRVVQQPSPTERAKEVGSDARANESGGKQMRRRARVIHNGLETPTSRILIFEWRNRLTRLVVDIYWSY